MTSTATRETTRPLSETTHPLAVEIARHACRAFASSRKFHDEVLDIIVARPAEEYEPWAMLMGGLVQIDIGAERACLDALMGLRAVDSVMDAPLVDRGNLGLAVDGNLYALVYDRDQSEEFVHESSRPSPGERWSRGVYKVAVVPLDQVLGLEPDRGEPPVPTAPPSTTFGVGNLGWRVAYVPDFVAFISARPCLVGVTCMPEPNGGAFVFTRLDGPDAEQVDRLNSLTAQYQ